MKNKILLPALILIALFLDSCSAIGGIFKAGMGFGIFIVIAVLLVIVVIAIRSSKK